MNRKLLIRIKNYTELEKVLNFLKSINEPVYDEYIDVEIYNNHFEDVLIGFLEDDQEWDWDGENFWDLDGTTTITYQQFFRQTKLERIAND